MSILYSNFKSELNNLIRQSNSVSSQNEVQDLIELELELEGDYYFAEINFNGFNGANGKGTIHLRASGPSGEFTATCSAINYAVLLATISAII